MLYAILCYNDEAAVTAWSKDQDDVVMKDLAAVQAKLAERGQLGPVARLQGTKAAKTLRKAQPGQPAVLLDGPFAETKEQFLGFYIVDVASVDEAADIARDLAKANPGTGAYELRPLAVFFPNVLPAPGESTSEGQGGKPS